MLVFCFGAVSLNATNIDSLLMVLNKSHGIEKAEVFLQLSAVYRTKSLDSAKLYANRALQIALKEDDKNTIGMSYNELGSIFIHEGKNKEAIRILDKGISLFNTKDEKLLYELMNTKGSALVYTGELDEGLKQFRQVLEFYKKRKDSLKMADLYNNIGIINYHKGEFETAMENMMSALDIYEKKGMYTESAAYYGNIAVIYNEIGNYEKAIEYNIKALNTYIHLEDHYSEAAFSINLANIYKNTDSLELSIHYLQDALKRAKENSYTKLEAMAYSNLGLVYEKQGRYDQAIHVIKKGLDIVKELGNPESETKNLRSLGSIYKKQKKYKLALEYLNESEKISEKIKLISEYYDLYKEKSEVYEALKDYENSLKYYHKYSMIKDSIFSEEKNRQITEIETKYQTEKKEKELIQLSDENGKQKLVILKNRYFLYGLIALIIIILLFGILLFRTNKIKSRQKTLELEQKLFRSQMNPHFIFNSLASIQFYITKNKPVEAGAYLSDFAKLMRLVIENSRKEYISLEQDIETMKCYIQMQALRFEYQFSHMFEVDPNLQTDDVLIPPMLTQPFIENVLEHAFDNKKENNLYVRYIRQNGSLSVEVEDNGIGREKARLTKTSDHQSFAISVTKSRLEKLNRKKRNKIHFEIIDLMSDTGKPSGTKVTFSIPLKYSE